MDVATQESGTGSTGHALTLLKVALAWAPFFVVWGLFIMVYGEATVSEAALSSVIAMGSAALLGAAVWWFSGRYSWPERLRISFYIVHLLVGSTYALAWLSVEYAMGAIEQRESIFALMARSRVIGWQFLMGMTLYAMIAGVSYSVRIRRRLREQERVAARAEALAVQAQLQTLRAQLNPHFLFNALHSLSALIPEDPRAAEVAIDRLGEMLRYALEEEGGEEVLLADEWRFTEHYLDIEGLRFNSRWQVETSFAPGTLSRPVPPFTLQPLVENAVRHGVAPRTEGGCVKIGASLDGAELVLTVEDDGPGSDPVTTSDAPGYGLRVLRQRLQAMYGARAAVNVDTAPGGGFRVTVRLPQERE